MGIVRSIFGIAQPALNHHFPTVSVLRSQRCASTNTKATDSKPITQNLIFWQMLGTPLVFCFSIALATHLGLQGVHSYLWLLQLRKQERELIREYEAELETV